MDASEAELIRLKNRVDREHKARLDSEAIAEKAIRELYGLGIRPKSASR